MHANEAFSLALIENFLSEYEVLFLRREPQVQTTRTVPNIFTKYLDNIRRVALFSEEPAKRFKSIFESSKVVHRSRELPAINRLLPNPDLLADQCANAVEERSKYQTPDEQI